MKYLIVLALLFSTTLHAAVVELKDRQDRVIRAELLELEAGNLTLRREDGRLFATPLDLLSDQSQQKVGETFRIRALPPSHWDDFFPNALVNAAGEEVSPRILAGKYVILFFSSAGCGPCQLITPKLKEFRDRSNGHVEVVLISQDRSRSDKLRHMRESGMKWPAVEWTDIRNTDEKAIREFVSRYNGWGIPTIVVFSPEGEIIDRQARMTIEYLPEENIRRLENFNYENARTQFRAEQEQRGERTTEAEEEAYLQRLRSTFATQIQEAERLRERTAHHPGDLGRSPTWEELLGAFYQSQRG